MLNISKALVAAQVKDYYKKEYTAKQNYWQQGATAPGTWTGRLAEEMGLSGAINMADFDRAADGKHPVTGDQIVRHVDRAGYRTKSGEEVKPMQHRAGWDATFQAPKSVSLTALVGGDDRVRAAHDHAVDVAVRRLERYIQARVSSDQAETTGKMLAAKFEHHTARPVNGYSAPHLHTHVVIFNMTEKESGGFSALQPKALFESQQYATSIYQAELMHQLKQLGYEIHAGKSGVPEIQGYSQEYLDASSPRRQQIEDHMQEHGVKGKEAAEIAAHSTRDKKQVLSEEQIHAANKEIAEKYGNQAERVVSEAAERHRAPGREQALESVEARQAVNYARDHNFEREAVSDERKLVRDALRRGTGTVRVDAVEKELGARIETGEFREVHHELAGRRHAGRSLTSQEAIDSEKIIIQTMQAGRGSSQPIMSTDAAQTQSTVRDFLNNSQRQAIQDVLTSNDRIMGIQGYAGTGKTTVLESIREGAERSGYVVQGFAPTSRAAQQLREAGISADTVQGFIAKGGQADDTKHLYMLDESSLASTTQMRDFLSKIAHEDRVLLVGDIRQHQAVDAGKPFEQLQQSGMNTSVLDTIMRQKDPELRQAVEHLSRNETKTAVEMLQQQGRIHEIKDAGERVDAIAKEYVKRPEKSVVVSPDNATRRDLNTAIRQRLQEQGKVSRGDHEYKILVNRPDITGADRSWAARYRVNEYVHYSRGSKVHNIPANAYARVTNVDSAHNKLTVETQQGQKITYDPARLNGVSIFKEESRMFAEGDKLQFTQPNKTLGVSNRDWGIVSGIDPVTQQMTVTMDNGRTVAFDPMQVRNFDHGYATTSYSSQCLTADYLYANLDLNVHPELLNTRFTYVAFSRGKLDAQGFTNDIDKLPSHLSKEVNKESALDANEYTKESRNKQEHGSSYDPANSIDPARPFQHSPVEAAISVSETDLAVAQVDGKILSKMDNNPTIELDIE
jgi:conjugative relaxase-like TrwC/TraI family protein